MKRTIALLCAAAATAVSMISIPTPASAAGNLPCGTTFADKDDSDYPDPDDVTKTANIRTGTASACSIVGQVLPGDTLNFHCYVTDAVSRTWTYLVDGRRAVAGWALDADLPNNGSYVPC